MKKMIATSIESVVFEGFEVLSNNDMLKVRGGEERPRTKDRDVFDEDPV
jgi:hypothetical protein